MFSKKINGWHVEKVCVRDLADFGTHSQKGCPPLMYIITSSYSPFQVSILLLGKQFFICLVQANSFLQFFLCPIKFLASPFLLDTY